MSKKSQPHIPFMIAALSLVIVGFVAEDKSIDIHVHDTYYVIGLDFMYFSFAVLMFVYTAIYFFCRRLLLSLILAWLHFLLIAVSIYFLLFFQAAGSGYPVISRRYLDFSIWRAASRGIEVAAIFFLTGNLCMLVNLVGGMIRNAKHKK